MGGGKTFRSRQSIPVVKMYELIDNEAIKDAIFKDHVHSEGSKTDRGWQQLATIWTRNPCQRSMKHNGLYLQVVGSDGGGQKGVLGSCNKWDKMSLQNSIVGRFSIRTTFNGNVIMKNANGEVSGAKSVN
jgi:hypothetical protein